MGGGACQSLYARRLWKHATPGTVEVLLVPYVPEGERIGGRVSAEQLQAQESAT